MNYLKNYLKSLILIHGYSLLLMEQNMFGLVLNSSGQELNSSEPVQNKSYAKACCN
jgi:hypothetical protein